MVTRSKSSNKKTKYHHEPISNIKFKEQSPLRTHIKPNIDENQINNPLFKIYQKNKNTTNPNLISDISEQYSLSILDKESLLYLKRYSPIIEIGAGNGYNAYLLNQTGTDIVAYDKAITQRQTWFPIKIGTDRHVKYYPNNNLMISWPPPTNEMAYHAIKNFNESSKAIYFIYLGEYRNTNGNLPNTKYTTGTPKFFDYLEKHYEEVYHKTLPNWKITSTKLYVFKKA